MYGNSFFFCFSFLLSFIKAMLLYSNAIYGPLCGLCWLFDPVSRKPGWNPIPSQLNPTFSCLHQCSYWLSAVFIETLLCFFISHSLPPENVNKYNKSSCRSKQCKKQPSFAALVSLRCFAGSVMVISFQWSNQLQCSIWLDSAVAHRWRCCRVALLL